MRSSQLNRDQKKMGMVGTTRRFWLLAPPKPLIELSPLSRKKTNPPSNCASWASLHLALFRSVTPLMTYSSNFEDQTHARLRFSDGAPGRTRTNTSVRKPDFEGRWTAYPINHSSAAQRGNRMAEPMAARRGRSILSSPSEPRRPTRIKSTHDRRG